MTAISCRFETSSLASLWPHGVSGLGLRFRVQGLGSPLNILSPLIASRSHQWVVGEGLVRFRVWVLEA